ncbi:MAG: class I SAM-dependent methyltransferase [bacterium]|nr:class I SAM-dependent methyltransferase [bacterium]
MKSQRELDALYDHIAPKYDLLNTLMSFGMDQAIRRKCARTLASGNILDIGSGSGQGTRALQEAHQQSLVVGVDRSAGMLDVAVGKDFGKYVRGDGRKLPFPEASFDGTSIGFVARPLCGDRDVIAEVYRTLRPGGRVVVYDTFRPLPGLAGLPYKLMLRIYVPLCGLIFANDATSYLLFSEMIRESITSEELATRLEDAGFGEVSIQRMLFGAITIIIAEKV